MAECDQELAAKAAEILRKWEPRTVQVNGRAVFPSCDWNEIGHDLGWGLFYPVFFNQALYSRETIGHYRTVFFEILHVSEDNIVWRLYAPSDPPRSVEQRMKLSENAFYGYFRQYNPDTVENLLRRLRLWAESAEPGGAKEAPAGVLVSRIEAKAGGEESTGNVHAEPQAGARHRGSHVLNERGVFIIHGRNHKVRDYVINILCRMGLDPIQWEKAKASLGTPHPYTMDVVLKGLQMGRAALVILTPDDLAQTREQWAQDAADRSPMGQPRLNVILEMGMALGRFEDRTVVLHVGRLRPISDWEGKQRIHFDGSDPSRDKLANALRKAGCEVVESDPPLWRTTEGEERFPVLLEVTDMEAALLLSNDGSRSPGLEVELQCQPGSLEQTERWVSACTLVSHTKGSKPHWFGSVTRSDGKGSEEFKRPRPFFRSLDFGSTKEAYFRVNMVTEIQNEAGAKVAEVDEDLGLVFTFYYNAFRVLIKPESHCRKGLRNDMVTRVVKSLQKIDGVELYTPRLSQ